MVGDLFERRDLDAGPVVGEQLFDGLAQCIFVGTRGEVDGDHIAIDMHGVHARVIKQATGQLIYGPVHLWSGSTGIALVPHTGDRTVDLKPNDTRIR